MRVIQHVGERVEEPRNFSLAHRQRRQQLERLLRALDEIAESAD